MFVANFKELLNGKESFISFYIKSNLDKQIISVSYKDEADIYNV